MTFQASRKVTPTPFESHDSMHTWRTHTVPHTSVVRPAGQGSYLVCGHSDRPRGPEPPLSSPKAAAPARGYRLSAGGVRANICGLRGAGTAREEQGAAVPREVASRGA
jgi:hypothetical protein